MELAELKALPRAVNYRQMVQDMFKEMGSEEATRIHAALGISGEVGELMLARMNSDFENSVEEGGDALFYVEKLLAMQNRSHEDLKALADALNITANGTDWRFGPVEGMIYEAASLLDTTKKSWVYGKALDKAELLNCLARFMEYLRHLCTKMGVTVEDLQAHNQWKLATGPNARYPSGKYSDAAAIARADKAAEAPASN